MPIDHYENFPVASLLLPRHLQAAVAQIYWFARSADDFADEGEAQAATRLDQLAAYDRQLERIGRGEALAPDCELARFTALAELIRTWPLSLRHFHDLLSAFSQDVVKSRYADYAQVLDYCSRSANPVGRLMLELYRHSEAANVARADAICSALQLINFWQDVAVDLAKDRIYLPADDLARFGVSVEALLERKPESGWAALMRFQCERARELMLQGAPLVKALPGRIGLELRLVVQGGLRILEKIAAVDYDVFHRRPTLGRSDWAVMLVRALRM